MYPLILQAAIPTTSSAAANTWLLALSPILIVIAAGLREVVAYMRSKRLAEEGAKNTAATSNKLQEIHILVNNQMSQALLEIAQLKQRLASLEPGNSLAQAQAEVAIANSNAKPVLAPLSPPMATPIAPASVNKDPHS